MNPYILTEFVQFDLNCINLDKKTIYFYKATRKVNKKVIKIHLSKYPPIPISHSYLFLFLFITTTSLAQEVFDPQVEQNKATPLVNITEINFDDFVKPSLGPLFVMFYVPSCIECKKLTPQLIQISKELHGSVNFGFADW